MKKRLFSVLAVALLLVGVISASAFGATNYKPKFSMTAAEATQAFSAIEFGSSFTAVTIDVTSDSADVSKVTLDKKGTEYIGGMTVETTVNNGAGTVKVSGTPTELLKNIPVTVTATGKGGNSTLKFKMTVVPKSSATALKITGPQTAWTGNLKNGSTVAAQTFSVNYPPVTWKTKNLPKGVTAKVSGNDLVISGTLSGVTKYSEMIGGEPQKNNYEITATNKNMDADKTATYTNSIIVYDTPALKTTKLPDMTTGKDYKAKVDFNNYPSEVTVKMGTTATGAAAIPSAGFTGGTDADNKACGALFWDDETRTIYGSFDRVPATNPFYVVFEMKDRATSAATTTVSLPITVKGVAPSFKKPDDNLGTADSNTITVGVDKGTPTGMTITAKIDGKVMETLSGGKVKTDTALSGTAETYSGLTWAQDQTAASGYVASGKLKWTTGNSAAKSFKGLKVTFTATNVASSKGVSKTYGFSLDPDDEPAWHSGSASGATVDETVVVKDQAGGDGSEFSSNKLPIAAGSAIPTNGEKTYYLAGKGPFVITGAETKNGITATYTDGGTNVGGTVKFAGTPTAGKDLTTKFKVVATNPMTKKKAALNVTYQSYAEPSLTNGADLANASKLKPVVSGKAVNIQGKVKAHKDLLPCITYTDTADATVFSDTGTSLTTDSDKGTFAITGSEGATKPTLDSSNPKKYTAKALTVTMKYPFTSTTAGTGVNKTVYLGIKPVTPKISTSTVTIQKGQTPTATPANIETSNITAAMTASGGSASLVFTPATLIAGVALATDTTTTNVGKMTLTANDLKATKGTAVEISASNYGEVGKKKVKFIIHDPAPSVADLTTAVSITGSATAAATGTATFANATASTGDTQIKWKVEEKPDGVSAKITSSSNDSCTVTITAKKKTEAVSGNLVVSATNSASKATDSGKVSVTVSAAPTTSTATKDGELAERDTAAKEPVTEADIEVGEGKVTLGKARTEAALTAAQRTAVAEAGYIVAAVLPEVSVTESGQYPFAVEIPEEIAAGKELVWFAFPKDAEPSEDDEIVDFFDEEGADTEVVPESHKITAYPWLNADVTYAPVIAVEADTGEAGAVTEGELRSSAEK